MMCNIFKAKKSQVMSADVAIAVSIFLVILIASFWSWEYFGKKTKSVDIRNDLEIISKNALDMLVQSPGVPSNWSDFSAADFNETSVLAIGLAESSSSNALDLTYNEQSAGLTPGNYLVLDESKVQQLDSLSQYRYDYFQRILGIYGSNYEFQLDVSPWDGSNYSQKYFVGRNMTDSSQNVVRNDRFALMNNTRSRITLFVWQDCGGVKC